MNDRTPEQEKLYQETRKLILECQALERDAKSRAVKTVLAFIAAFAFVISFAIDRYNVAEQRHHDRRVAVATELDNLVSKTVTSITTARPTAITLNLNVSAYKEKLEALRKRSRDRSDAVFVAESIRFADELLKSNPDYFEFKQWTNAIEAEAVWAGRERAFTPDFESLFGEELAAQWKTLREKALAAISHRFSLMDSSDLRQLTDFRHAASDFQGRLQDKIR